jgi:hydroxymethylbilane synthase
MARVQTGRILRVLRAYHPELRFETIFLPSAGDLDWSVSLDHADARGLFTDDLDAALRAGEADLCIHSLKDLPYTESSDLVNAAYAKRDDPREAFVLPDSSQAGSFQADSLPEPESAFKLSGPIGCSCARRRVQIRRLFPNCETAEIRGAVPRRLERLDGGEYGGLVLAMAGLERLSLTGRAGIIFEPEQFVPAAGQGVVAVRGRQGEDHGYLDCVHDPLSEKTSLIERGLERSLTAAGASAAAAYARVEGGTICLTGLVTDKAARAFVKKTVFGGAASANALAEGLRETLLKEREYHDAV